MLAEFLRELLSRTDGRAEALPDGRIVFSKPMHNPPLPEEPNYPTISVHSLDGVVEIIDSTPAAATVVCSARRVDVLGAEFGKRRQRPTFVSATCLAPEIQPAQYLPLEQFRLQLMTCFEGTPDRDTVLQLTSKVVAESIGTAQDDGMSQTVKARTGIAAVSEVKAPPVIMLRQIRSFHEVQQVESPFVFRMRLMGNSVEAALFGLASGWQLKQAQLVAEYIKNALGEDKIPVLV